MKKNMLAVLVCMSLVSSTAIASLTNTEGGTVKAAIINSATVWESGTMVSLTAVPDLGWRFDHWAGADVGDVADPNSSQTRIMDGINTSRLCCGIAQVYAVGQHWGNGSVAKSPDQAESIWRRPVSDSSRRSGWGDHWTGDLSGSVNPASVVMDTISLLPRYSGDPWVRR